MLNTACEDGDTLNLRVGNRPQFDAFIFFRTIRGRALLQPTIAVPGPQFRKPALLLLVAVLHNIVRVHLTNQTQECYKMKPHHNTKNPTITFSSALKLEL